MKERIELLKAMHEIVLHMNHEGAYMKWIYIVPDCPEEDDFEFIAETENLFKDAVECFKDTMKIFLKHGIYIGNKLY